MAENGKKISEQSVVESLQGNELIPFAKNGTNAVVKAETIKEYATDGLDGKYATIERVNDLLDGFAPKSHLAQTDQEVSRINDALIGGLADKVSKEDGKGLSSNDFTDADKAKLDGIEDGAQVNTVDSVNGRTGAVTGLAEASAIPTKVSELQNDSKFQTETQVENRVAILSEVWDAQLVDAFNNLDNSKVDKVEGKQLSTEDFTTLLKSKLDGLTNYDDTTLTAELNALKSRLDTLVGSGDVTAVIDTFQEIEAFLQGVTNTQTLTGLLQEMKSEIVALCADTYLPLSGGKIIGDNTNPLKISAPNEDHVTISFYNKDNQESNAGYIGYVKFQGAIIRNSIAGKNLGIKDSGIPHYDGNELLHKGNYSSTIFKGTSSQFLKADGSVDNTAYLPKSGGDITKGNSLALTVGDKLDGSIAIELVTKNADGTKQGGFGAKWTNNEYQYHYIGWGGTAYNLDNNLAIGQNIFTYKNNKIWHEDNDGANSGLDADLLDGKQPADLNVGSANKLTTKQLTNENLDTIKGENNTFYIAAGGNAVVNSPIGDVGFYLSIYRSSNNYLIQLLINADNGNIYRRACVNGTWKNWQQIATTADNTGGINIKNLNETDLNDVKSIPFIVYQGNGTKTTLNNPLPSTRSFILKVYGVSSSYIIQEITDVSIGITYRRNFASTAWSEWKQLATTDGAVAKLTTKQLTNEDLNDIKDMNFSVYTAHNDNTCTNKPSIISGSFGLHVSRYGTGGFRQLIFSHNYTFERRYTGSTWSTWKKMLTEDDIASLVSRIEALENQ